MDRIVEGKWRGSTHKIGDDTVTIELPSSDKRCSPVNTLRHMDSAIAKDEVRKGSKFYLLKVSEGQVCAQKCNIEDSDYAIQHDCDIKKGNSGDPMFMVKSAGFVYLIGVQSSENQFYKRNFAVPISDDNHPDIW